MKQKSMVQYPEIIAQFCAVITAVIAIITFVGWATGIMEFTSILEQYKPIAPSSSLALLSFACALFLLARWPTHKFSQHAALIFIFIPILIGMLVLYKYISRSDLVFLRTFHRLFSGSDRSYTVQMSLLSSVAILITGLSLFVLSGFNPRKILYRLSAALSGIVTGFCILFTLGYLYARPLFYTGSFVPPSWPTAIMLCFIGAGILSLFMPHIEGLRYLFGSSITARLLRAYLPIMLLLIVFENFLDDWIVHRGHVSNPAIWAAIVSLAATLLVILGVWLTSRMIGSDLSRNQSLLIENERHFRTLAIQHEKDSAALRQSEKNYQQLFNSMIDGFAIHQIICDNQGKPVDYRFLAVNPAFEKLTGLVGDKIVGKTVLEVLPGTESYWIDTYGRVALTGEATHFENYNQPLDRWYEVTAFQPSPRQFACVFVDITTRKRAENDLRAALGEKEVLLKEVHHRVKNNLQIISSLLSLRAEAIEDPAAQHAFQECQNSVQAIGLIHETLYQSKNLAHVDAADYIPNLVEYLNRSLGNQSIDLVIDIASIILDANTAIPCGLILTEIFTNTIKHAFPPKLFPAGANKQISIRLYQEQEQIIFHVKDSGVGLPPEFDTSKASSLGLQLVFLLIHQLRGSVEVNNENGTSFRIVFPLTTNYKKDGDHESSPHLDR